MEGYVTVGGFPDRPLVSLSFDRPELEAVRYALEKFLADELAPRYLDAATMEGAHRARRKTIVGLRLLRRLMKGEPC